MFAAPGAVGIGSPSGVSNNGSGLRPGAISNLIHETNQMHGTFDTLLPVNPDVFVNDEDDVSDDGSMPELMDRGDISSSDDESDDETYYPDHPMAFVEPDNEAITSVNRYEPYGTVDEVHMVTTEPNMTITQRVSNGWKPNDDLETAMEQEWEEYEERMINETHGTYHNNGM